VRYRLAQLRRLRLTVSSAPDLLAGTQPAISFHDIPMPKGHRRIVVVTHAQDRGATHVVDRLRARGARVHVIDSEALGQRHTVELRLSHPLQSGARLVVDDVGGFDRGWFRRLRNPAPSPALHIHDRPFAERESREFVLAMLSDVGGSCQWFNEPARAIAAENKYIQLARASRLGMRVPRTLMSSSRPAVLRFFDEVEADKIIYKPFRVGDWSSSAGRIGRASVVSRTDIPSDRIMRACPGIFQERIDKAFEVRSLVLGAEAVSARLNSRHLVDWREAGFAALEPERYTLDRSIRGKCTALLGDLGLRMGAFDFIVTPQGETVFLEVNQQGEFVMMDLALPQLAVVDKFCDFILE
jgi:glutathione synthase/RimK-type ligase-like ATP-grasp enzyme